MLRVRGTTRDTGRFFTTMPTTNVSPADWWKNSIWEPQPLYLDDYADTYVTLDERGSFDRRTERRAFELVIAYDRTPGSHAALEM